MSEGGGGMMGPMLRIYFALFWVMYSITGAATIYTTCGGLYGFVMGAMFFVLAICIIYVAMFKSGD